MKLLLTSSGKTNQSIERSLLHLLGKPFNKSNLVFIPTAANADTGDKSWLVDGMYNFRKLNFSSFDVVDIAAVSKEIWLPSFEKSDVMVFGGGNVNYLIEWMEKSGVKALLPELLTTRVYVGISAGSMVTARHVSLDSSSLLYYEKTEGLEVQKGLGFVDFEIRPHLNSKWFPKVTLQNLENVARATSIPFYAIDDNTAIQVVGDRVEVISEGKWKQYH